MERFVLAIRGPGFACSIEIADEYDCAVADLLTAKIKAVARAKLARDVESSLTDTPEGPKIPLTL